MVHNKNIMLLACGSFNPPTNMHLRIFEIARDTLRQQGFCVVGGIISPVHDGYGKKDLASADDRCLMVRRALHGSDWIQLSDWECSQDGWVPTKQVLQHHQDILDTLLGKSDDSPPPARRPKLDDFNWIPPNVNENEKVKVKLLCGADLLESFGTPGLWKTEDLEEIIGRYGLVVITREGSNPFKFIYESDLLTKYKNNITIVMEWIVNEVSSTKIRRALRRSESVKYLIPDSVIEYIERHSLYKNDKNENTKQNNDRQQ